VCSLGGGGLGDEEDSVLFGMALVAGCPEVEEDEGDEKGEGHAQVAGVDVGLGGEDQGVDDSAGGRQATDETGGEKDVEKYVIYRRIPPAVFADPLAAIPAGQATYSFTDTQATSGTNFVYGVAAEDCGGQYSPTAVSNQVTVP